MNRNAVVHDPAFRSRLLKSATRQVIRWQVDILVLAEYTGDPQDMVSLLNASNPGSFAHSPSNEPKLAIFGRTATVKMTHGNEGTRFTTRHITLEGHTLLLVAVHMPDKSHWSDESQATEALFINNDILREEDKAGHRRTLIVGDLNMDPFEYGVIAAGHFHGVMTRELAEKHQRKIMERQHLFFFNPMWSFYGDIHAGPPGTYYQWRSEPKCYFWNLFDQILLRPDLLPFFPGNRQRRNLRILTTDGVEHYLDDNGIPDKKQMSDHLPLMLRLEL